MTQHEHTWNFIRTFIGDGEEKIMQRMVVDVSGEPVVQMYTDARQEYALYHCVCGEKKEVAL